MFWWLIQVILFSQEGQSSMERGKHDEAKYDCDTVSYSKSYTYIYKKIQCRNHQKRKIHITPIIKYYNKLERSDMK